MVVLQVFVNLSYPPRIGEDCQVSPLLLTLLLTTRHNGTKLDSGLSPRTVQYIPVVLHLALKQALRWGLVVRNVAEAVEPPRVLKKVITPLSPSRLARFSKLRGPIAWKPSTSSPSTPA
jgi:hypothetical protein